MTKSSYVPKIGDYVSLLWNSDTGAVFKRMDALILDVSSNTTDVILTILVSCEMADHRYMTYRLPRFNLVGNDVACYSISD